MCEIDGLVIKPPTIYFLDFDNELTMTLYEESQIQLDTSLFSITV